MHVELPPVYKKYASVFSEEEVQQFPPSRIWDHAIDFKDGAPNAINCKVYPMTRTEDDALDKFSEDAAGQRLYLPVDLPLCFVLLLHQDEGWEASTSTGLPKYQ